MKDVNTREYRLITGPIGEHIAVIEVNYNVEKYGKLLQTVLEDYHGCGIEITHVGDFGLVIYETEFSTDKYEVTIEYIPIYTLKDL